MKEYHLSENQYLSKTIVAELLKTEQNYVVISDTNTGKTQACLKAAQESGQNFIFAVDSKLLADQLSEAYGVPVFYSGKPMPESNCITLYNHVELFKDNNTILFIDEFHSIIKDYGYKKDVIDNMMKQFKNYRQVIGLTGTPIAPVDTFEDVRIIRERSQREINLINYKGSYMDYLIFHITQNMDKVHYISIFDKSNDSISIQANLSANGFKDSEIACINSETKDSKAFRDLVTKKKVEGCKVIITTYTQGFNIVGKNYMLHIIPKNKACHSASDIEQVVNRFRNEVPVINSYWNHIPNHQTSFNEVKQHALEDIEAKEVIGVFGSQVNWTSSDNLSPFHHNLINYHLKAESIYNVTVDLKPNLIGIHYNVHNKKTNEMYLDFSFMEKNLSEYKYRFISLEGGIIVNTDNLKATKIKKTNYEYRVNKQKERVKEIYENKFSISPTDDLSRRYAYLLDYYSPIEAFEKLNNILLDKKKWNKEIDLLNVKYSKGLINTALKDRVYGTFIENQYSSEEILNKLNEIHASFGIPLLDTLTKASQLFSKYFETRPWKVNHGTNGRISGRKIISKIAI